MILILPLIAVLSQAMAMPDTGDVVFCADSDPVTDDDYDGDGLDDIDELDCGSDPCAPDTDLDGVWDGEEAEGPGKCGPDSDGDGVRDLLDPDSPEASGSIGETVAPESGSHGLTGGSFTGGACSVGGTSPVLLPTLLVIGALLGRRRWPLLLASAGASTAHAIDVQRLQPNLEDSSFVGARDARIGPYGFGAGILSHYARSPMVYRAPDSQTAIVSDLWTTDIGASLRNNGMAIGFQLPIHGWVSGLSTPNPRWLGDTRVMAKVGLLELDNGSTNVSGMVQLGIPTGNSDGWLGASTTHSTGHLAVSGGESVRWTVNLGGLWLPRTDLGDLTWGPALSWRTGVSLPLTSSLAVAAELDGAQQLIQADADGAHPVEALASARLSTGDNLSFVLGGGGGITRGVGAPDYRVLIGAIWSPHAQDAPAPTPPQVVPEETPAPTSEPVIQLPEPEPEPTPPTQTVNLLDRTVRFKPGSAELDLTATSALESLALILLDHPELGKIEVQGFAGGTQAQSAALSLSRAETVMIWLVDNGVSPSRLSARGYGATLSEHITDPDAKERVQLHQVQPDPPSAQ